MRKLLTIMSVTPERDVIAELNQVRLDDDLSYAKLARAVGGITAKALQRAITDRSTKPYDRTLNKITTFLDRRKAATSERRRSSKQQAQA